MVYLLSSVSHVLYLEFIYKKNSQIVIKPIIYINLIYINLTA